MGVLIYNIAKIKPRKDNLMNHVDMPLDSIIIPTRKRSLNPDKANGLASSMAQSGLINPITLSDDGTLLAGLHRIEAAKILQWQNIPAILIKGLDALQAELIEIDENVVRDELTALQYGAQLNRRNEILTELGLRAKPGWNGNQYTLGGEIISPPTNGNTSQVEESPLAKTTEQIAKEAGLSERSAQQRMQIDKNLSQEVKDLITGTELEDKLVELLSLSRLPFDLQLEVAGLILDSKAKNVDSAMKQIKSVARNEKARTETAERTEGRASVELSNAIDWLSSQGQCDLLLTDPPYSTDVDDIAAFAAEWLPVALTHVKSTGRAYIFIGAYPAELLAYLSVQLPTQVLVWEYRNTIGPNPALKYKQNWQAILYYCMPDAPPLNGDNLVEKFSVQNINAPDARHEERFHAWEKPIKLANLIIKQSTNEGDIIFDPFAGTGTFLLSAAINNRTGLGCEQSKTMIDICESRGINVV